MYLMKKYLIISKCAYLYVILLKKHFFFVTNFCIVVWFTFFLDFKFLSIEPSEFNQSTRLVFFAVKAFQLNYLALDSPL